jgi:maleate isomerase
MQSRTLLGVLTPSSNTRLEPLTAAMLAGTPSVTAHFTRFRVTDVGLAAAGQFDPGPIVEAAGLLADARVDSIVWSGTSGGWRGIADDQALCAAINAATGVPATTSTLALLAALRLLGTRRLGLVTPYPADMHNAVASTLAGEGFDVIASANDGFTTSNWELSTLPPERIGALLAEVAGSAAARTAGSAAGQVAGAAARTAGSAGPEAITVFCTNLAAADRVEDWEAKFGIPVLDSVTLAVWHALELSGYPGPRPEGWGRLFSLRAKQLAAPPVRPRPCSTARRLPVARPPGRRRYGRRRSPSPARTARAARSAR